MTLNNLRCPAPSESWVENNIVITLDSSSEDENEKISESASANAVLENQFLSYENENFL